MNIYSITTTLLAMTLAACCLAQFAVLQRQRSSLLKQIEKERASRKQIEQQMTHLKEQFSLSQSFQQKLAEADLSTRLQNMQASETTSPGSTAVPERYQYAASLIQQGMKANELAEVLRLSTTETQQLVALASLQKEH